RGGVVARLPDRAPAHVRDLEALAAGRLHRLLAEAHDAARNRVQAFGRALLAAVEQHLEPEADAEEWTIVQDGAHRIDQPALDQPLHAVRHRALAGQGDTFAPTNPGRT